MVVPVAGGRNLQTLPCHCDVAGFLFRSLIDLARIGLAGAAVAWAGGWLLRSQWGVRPHRVGCVPDVLRWPAINRSAAVAVIRRFLRLTGNSWIKPSSLKR